jgi:hypothetical protein
VVGTGYGERLDQATSKSNRKEKKRKKNKKRDAQERYNKKRKRSMNGVRTGFWARLYSLVVGCSSRTRLKQKRKKKMRWLEERLDHRCDVGTGYDNST